MASYESGYRTAVEVRPGQFEQLLRLLLETALEWLRPRLERAARFLFAEVLRGVIVLAALGFALAAAAYGTIYFFAFLVELLSQWMPHWAALLTTSATMLVPAGCAALLGLWQLAKLRTVRTAVAGAAYLSAATQTWLRRTRTAADDSL
ncbi:phage holin family protein [Nocardia sp. NPDC088792]|uniref:phage holin family protein n=1 Tax=Nocardia sp. NPDC088792 TaxID=3364332 RepID=UPI00380321E0